MNASQASILLIDPDLAQRTLVTTVLAPLGSAMTAAADLTAAAAYLESQDYDLIIMAAQLHQQSPSPVAPLLARRARKPLILLGETAAVESMDANALTAALPPLSPAAAPLLLPLAQQLLGRWQERQRQSSAGTERHVEELTVLHDVATICAQANHEDSLIEQVTQIIGDNFYPDNFGFLLVDETSQILRTHPSYRPRQPDGLETIPLGHGITGYVAATGHSLRLHDVSQHPAYYSGDARTRSELCVPLKIGQRVLGVINAESAAFAAFTAADERLLATLASQLAIAIERLRHEASERQRAQQLTIIYEVGRHISSILDVDLLLAEVVRLLAARMGYYNASVAFCQGDYLIYRAGYGGYVDGKGFISDANPRIAEDVLSQTLQDGRPQIIPDVSVLPEFEPYYRLPHIRSLAGVPLRMKDEIIGLLSVSSDRPYGVTPSDAALLEILADQIESAMQNAQLYQESQRQMRELAGLYETALVTGGTLSPKELFQRLYQQVKQLLMPDIFLAATYLEASQELEITAAVEEDAPIAEWVGWRLPLAAGGLTGWVMQHKRTLLIGDMEKEPLPAEPRRILQPVRSWLGVPLMVRDWLIGAFSLQSFRPHAFTAADQRFVESLANQVAVSLQNARLFAETNRRARQLAILNQLAREMGNLLDVNDMADLIAHRLVEGFGYLAVAVFTLNEARDELWLRGIAGVFPPHLQPLVYRHPLTAHEEPQSDLLSQVVYSGDPALVNEAAPAAANSPSPIPVGAELALPIMAGERIVGVLKVNGNAFHAFDDSDIALLTTVTDQLAVTIEKTRLFKETQRRANELEILTEISARLRAARTVDEILPVMLSKSISLIGGVQSAVFLLDLETGELTLRARYPAHKFGPGRRQSLQAGITGHVARTGEIHISPHIQADPMFHPASGDEAYFEELVTAIALPLRAEAQIIGVMHLALDARHTFSEEELRILTAVAEIAGSALYRAMVLETLERRVALRTQELAQANERLQEMDRIRAKFVADVSHELRTPVANLMLYLDLMERGAPEKQARYLSVLRDETKRLAKIIDPILNFSRYSLEEAPLNWATVDLNGIAAQVVAHYQAATAGSGAAIQFVPDQTLPPVPGDGERLASVVANLVANAVSYARRGQITVTTFAADDGREVCLQVQDEGMGIAPTDRPHLFEQFYRGEQTSQSNIPGTGLGLTIVRHVVQQHGGRVEVQSEVGQGATFRVWLPVHPF